eukprot:2059422-Ditylum_brightwellii.AAC.1
MLSKIDKLVLLSTELLNNFQKCSLVSDPLSSHPDDHYPPLDHLTAFDPHFGVYPPNLYNDYNNNKQTDISTRLICPPEPSLPFNYSRYVLAVKIHLLHVGSACITSHVGGSFSALHV